MGKNGSHSKTKQFVEVLKNKSINAGNFKVADCATSSKNMAKHFTKDYMMRHKHPVNAALHVVGVPCAFYGFYYLFSGKDISRGGAFVFLGYLLQYLGHKAQGNEVGEVTLAKSIYKKLKGISCCSKKEDK